MLHRSGQRASDTWAMEQQDAHRQHVAAHCHALRVSHKRQTSCSSCKHESTGTMCLPLDTWHRLPGSQHVAGTLLCFSAKLHLRREDRRQRSCIDSMTKNANPEMVIGQLDGFQLCVRFSQSYLSIQRLELQPTKKIRCKYRSEAERPFGPRASNVTDVVQ